MGCLRALQQTRTLTTTATVTTSGAAGAAGVGQRSRSGTSNVSHTARHTVFGFSPSASAWFTVRSPRAASTWSLATLSAYASPNCARIRSQNSVRRTAARLPAGAWDSASPRGSPPPRSELREHLDERAGSADGPPDDQRVD